MENRKVLLSVDNLHVNFKVRGRTLSAIRGISLDFYENESVAIVGESGYSDREALFIDLMSRGLRYDVAYFLGRRLSQGQTLRKEDEAMIRDVLSSDSVEKLLNTRYIPPRSDAAKRALTYVELL